MLRHGNRTRALLSLAVAMLWLCASFGAANAQTPVSVGFSWNANKETDLAGYKLYQRCGANSVYPNQPVVTLGLVLTYTTTVTPTATSQTCFWTLTAYDKGGLESAHSNEVSKVIPGLPPTAPPSVPALSATATGPTTITATYPPVADGAGGTAAVNVRYAVAPINWGTAPSATCTASPCVITGLTPATHYQLQSVGSRLVAGKNVFGPISAPIDVTTPPLDSPPAPPAGLTILSQTSSQIVIVAKLADCPKGIGTSTVGSTTTVTKQTVTCAK